MSGDRESRTFSNPETFQHWVNELITGVRFRQQPLSLTDKEVGGTASV